MAVAFEVLIVGGIAAVAGTVVLAIRAFEKKRRAAYEEYCLPRGFRFEAERPKGDRLRRRFAPEAR